MKLYCATTNPGKLREFALAAREHGIEIEPVPELKSIEAPEESGSTFEENAILKAVYYSQFTDAPVFADDSGLAVNALHGEPGVYSARYAGENATDEDNNRLLIAKLQNQQDRTARFVCVIALAQAGKCLGTYRGEVRGRIVDDPRGPNGFGYDPHFYFDEFGCTFGEASSEQKLGVSHRGQALRAMLQHLDSQPGHSIV